MSSLVAFNSLAHTPKAQLLSRIHEYDFQSDHRHEGRFSCFLQSSGTCHAFPYTWRRHSHKDVEFNGGQDWRYRTRSKEPRDCTSPSRSNDSLRPKVYRFCFVNEYGYLVTEFIEGKTYDQIDSSQAVSSLLATLEHFRSIEGRKAGPLAGGSPCGSLFLDCHDQVSNVEEIEEYFNIRLRKRSKAIILSERKLKLFHTDLAGRDILFMNDGTISILDWDTAGFYPQPLEFCSLYMNSFDDPFLSRALLALRKTGSYPADDVLLLQEAFTIGHRYYL